MDGNANFGGMGMNIDDIFASAFGGGGGFGGFGGFGGQQGHQHQRRTGGGQRRGTTYTFSFGGPGGMRF